MKQNKENKSKVLKKSDINITSDYFAVLYDQNKDLLETEDERKARDLTAILYKYFSQKLAMGGLINMQVRGEVTSGKSTVAIQLMYLGLTLMGINKNIIHYIIADQTEFLRKKNDLKNCFVTIDEFDKMMGTGLNATTEQAEWLYYSDVFAQEFVHRISCSPFSITDPNATLILDVMGKDKENMTTRCKVIYRDISTNIVLTLGHADIYVGDVINMPWYKDYRTKKFKRMELLKRMGVSIRDLEWSQIILETFESLKDFAKEIKIKPIYVDGEVDEIAQKHGRKISLITKQHLVGNTISILHLYYEWKNNERLMHSDETQKRFLYEMKYKKAKMLFTKRLNHINELVNTYNDYINIGMEYEKNKKNI